MKQIKKKKKYDPAVYGKRRAELLQKISEDRKYFRAATITDSEVLRQRVLKDIKEGRLTTTKP